MFAALKRGLLTIFIAALVVYSAVVAMAYFNQRNMLYFPVRHAAVPGNQSLEREDGVSVKVNALVRPGTQALIYFGGNGEDVSYNLQPLSDTFACHSIYLMHYRGYGGSGGRPNEADIQSDALALFDQIKAKHPSITLIGRSLGSGVATYVASQRPVQRLVLVTPFDSIVRLGQRHYPYLPVDWLSRERYESWRYAPDITAPTLVLIAGNDRIVPRVHSEALIQSFATGTVEHIVLDGVGHNSISANPQYYALLAKPHSD